jgi:hypothetical protein
MIGEPLARRLTARGDGMLLEGRSTDHRRRSLRVSAIDS